LNASEAARILDTWRTSAQRRIATEPPYLDNVWLRTYYGPGSDEKHEVIIDEINLEWAIDEEDRLLDDPELYNYGEHWEHILEIIPELVRREPGFNWQQYWEKIEECKDKCVLARRLLSGESINVPERPGLNVAHTIEWFRTLYPAEELDRHVMETFQAYLHGFCFVNWIYIFDEQAFTSGKFLIVWLDPCGNVVRSNRADIELAEGWNAKWMSAAMDEVEEWMNADIGDAYRLGGRHENLYFLDS
jgi:hypothetical protein